MRRVQSLIALFLFSVLIQQKPACAQDFERGGLFVNYQRELLATSRTEISNPDASAVLDPSFSKKFYERQQKLEASIMRDVTAIFDLYLQSESIDFGRLKVSIESDPYLKSNLVPLSSSVIRDRSLERINQFLPNLPLSSEIKTAYRQSRLLPARFRLISDSSSVSGSHLLQAYYERGSQKIVMSLNQTDPANWLIWFVHEYIHFFDPVLRSAETRLNSKPLRDILDQFNGPEFIPAAQSQLPVLNQYLLDLTDLTLKAEWRAWIATTLFAQLALKKGLLRKIPPSLQFLEVSGLGSRMLTVVELRGLWWKKLKPGFVIFPQGLLLDPYWAKQLSVGVDQVDPLSLPLDPVINLIQ